MVHIYYVTTDAQYFRQTLHSTFPKRHINDMMGLIVCYSNAINVVDNYSLSASIDYEEMCKAALIDRIDKEIVRYFLERLSVPRFDLIA